MIMPRWKADLQLFHNRRMKLHVQVRFFLDLWSVEVMQLPDHGFLQLQPIR